jgi:hypothetical protein
MGTSQSILALSIIFRRTITLMLVVSPEIHLQSQTATYILCEKSTDTTVKSTVKLHSNVEEESEINVVTLFLDSEDMILFYSTKQFILLTRLDQVVSS